MEQRIAEFDILHACRYITYSESQNEFTAATHPRPTSPDSLSPCHHRQHRIYTQTKSGINQACLEAQQLLPFCLLLFLWMLLLLLVMLWPTERVDPKGVVKFACTQRQILRLRGEFEGKVRGHLKGSSDHASYFFLLRKGNCTTGHCDLCF